jgi:hypothetical protein
MAKSLPITPLLYSLIDKVLIVKVSSGLCNRLRVLLCAIAYSEITSRKLIIHWQLTPKFNTPLWQLFCHPYKEIGINTFRIFRKLAGKVHSHNEIRFDMPDKILIIDTVHTFCMENFSHSLISYFSRMKPIQAINEKTDSFYKKKLAGKKIIGIQLRHKNAHFKTLQNSSPQWFIYRINEIHRKFPDIEFFLSTDCLEMSELLRANTKAIIHEIPKTFQYDQLDGLKEAICDLYVLARTNYILGSYWSSFSQFARWMRGTDAYEDASTMKSDFQLSKYLGIYNLHENSYVTAGFGLADHLSDSRRPHPILQDLMVQ